MAIFAEEPASSPDLPTPDRALTHGSASGRHGAVVRLSEHTERGDLSDYVTAAEFCEGDLGRALTLAVLIGSELPPTATNPLRRWEALATLAAADMTVARCVETHLHAVEVLQAIDATDPGSVGLIQAAVSSDVTSAWAVWVAQSADPRVVAEQCEDGWRLVGVQPSCPLAGLATHALVDAYVDGWRRALFAIDLRGSGVTVMPATEVENLHAADLPCRDVAFQSAAAFPASLAGWPDLQPAADWDGVATAACWYGEAVGLARRLVVKDPVKMADPVAQMHAAALDADLFVARLALREAAASFLLSGGSAADSVHTSLRTRAAVGSAVERIMDRLGRTSGLPPRARWDLSELGSRLANGARGTWEI